jgi:2-amino-4-hydroxy-6-hydroxymethyldihydropteridine diphosphokinase
MPRCHIALGGNVGDVKTAFQTALAGLTAGNPILVIRVSSICHTRPVGAESGTVSGTESRTGSGDVFLNAAAEIETSLEPLQLLDVLKEQERRAGRAQGERWAPRPLDLDLIFYADRVIEHSRLTVPHPACWYRRFVLDPLAEIAAEVRHPIKGISVRDLRARLLARPLGIALAGSAESQRERIRRELSTISAELQIVDWLPKSNLSPEPAILAWLGPDAGSEDRLDFDALPVVPRLDVARAVDATVFLRGVVQSALG